jgi:hypothetical protein
MNRAGAGKWPGNLPAVLSGILCASLNPMARQSRRRISAGLTVDSMLRLYARHINPDFLENTRAKDSNGQMEWWHQGR